MASSNNNIWQPFTILNPRYMLALSLGLPPPRNPVDVQRDISVVMPDGVRLPSDHYAPRGAGPCPTILIRTPYGRGNEARFGAGLTLAELPAQRFAERGYHVIVQGVRGRFGAEGSFTPHLDEAADGAATINWIRQQSWFDGRLATWGPSYLGYTQWAAATAVPKAIRAMVPIVTSAEPFSISYPNGAFGLETRLRWFQGMALLNLLRQGAWAELMGAESRLRRAFNTLPLLEADRAATGAEIATFRDIVQHNRADDPFWQARDHTSRISDVHAPVHFIGGWYDYFLRPLLRDYATLTAAGRGPHLTIGPWTHAHPGTLVAGMREGLRWFDLHLRAEGSPRPQPVSIFVTGANVWRSYNYFPPPATERRLHLQPNGRLLAAAPAADAAPTQFSYDPANPTPSVGGALLGPDAGPRDNRRLEARTDVLCYTTPPLRTALEVIGTIRLILFVRSSLAHSDFVGRICDVGPDGRSINRCDGMIRVAPGVGEQQADGSLRIVIALDPIAHRFERNHRIRLQIAGGSHPRWNRNLGTGEPEATAVQSHVAHQTIYHDADHQSILVLPVIEGGAGAW